MNAVKPIRNLLGETQAELADGIGVSQGNVSFYENGATLLPEVAMRLMAHAKDLGLSLSLDQVYGIKPLPKSHRPKRADPQIHPSP